MRVWRLTDPKRESEQSKTGRTARLCISLLRAIVVWSSSDNVIFFVSLSSNVRCVCSSLQMLKECIKILCVWFRCFFFTSRDHAGRWCVTAQLAAQPGMSKYLALLPAHCFWGCSEWLKRAFYTLLSWRPAFVLYINLFGKYFSLSVLLCSDCRQ